MPAMSAPSANADASRSEAPLSLRRLTDAFAVMLGRKPKLDGAQGEATLPIRELTPDPRSITEAVLFVGQSDNAPLSAQRIASFMRDVSADEVQQVVAELNQRYAAQGNPYVILSSAAGYRLVLRDEFARVRDKFHGNVRQAKLSPATLEVLSLVAYRQPITLADIDLARGEKCLPLVNQLVRRGLVVLDRPADRSVPGTYHTTARFLQVFGITSLDQLPRLQEFDMPAAEVATSLPSR
jgi:segregation and condensation protein B